MLKALFIFSFTFLVASQSPSAITGHWKGSVSDQFDVTVFFEAKDNKVTAKVQSQIGETIFTNGKIAGDSLSFTDQSFNGITIESLKGKITGETMNFIVTFQGQDMKGFLNKVK